MLSVRSIDFTSIRQRSFGLVNSDTITLAEKHQHHLVPVQLVLVQFQDNSPLQIGEAQHFIIADFHFFLLVQTHFLEVHHLSIGHQHPYLNSVYDLQHVELQRQVAKDQTFAPFLHVGGVGHRSQNSQSFLISVDVLSFLFFECFEKPDFRVIALSPFQGELFCSIPFFFEVIYFFTLHLIEFGDSLYFLFVGFDFRSQVVDLFPEVGFSDVGFFHNVMLEDAAVLEFDPEGLNFYGFLSLLDFLESFGKFFFFFFYPALLFVVFLCAIVLFISFVDALGLLRVEGIYFFDAVVDVLYELHFEFELSVLFDLGVEVVNFFMQVFYFFDQVHWLAALIHDYDISYTVKVSANHRSLQSVKDERGGLDQIENIGSSEPLEDIPKFFFVFFRLLVFFKVKFLIFLILLVKLVVVLLGAVLRLCLFLLYFFSSLLPLSFLFTSILSDLNLDRATLRVFFLQSVINSTLVFFRYAANVYWVLLCEK